MKKIVYLLLLTTFVSFGQEVKKFKVKFTAKIENRNSDTLTIYGPGGLAEKIPFKDGKFSATFETVVALHQFHDGKESSTIFFKEGDDLTLTMDAKEFDETIKYKGKGAVENNYLAKQALEDEKFDMNFEELLNSEESKYKEAYAKRKESDTKLLSSFKIDENGTFFKYAKSLIEWKEKDFAKYYNQKRAQEELVGKKSPTFDYENYKGGKTSLESLKGKYVYIDVWATWCGPCRAEIPHLKKVEETYHEKNIEFVSISIDRAKDHDKWKQFVADKELGGIQLFADNDWNSQFVKDYQINGIPRFILVGPNGEIVNADAPRPSSPELVKTLDSLLK